MSARDPAGRYGGCIASMTTGKTDAAAGAGCVGERPGRPVVALHPMALQASTTHHHPSVLFASLSPSSSKQQDEEEKSMAASTARWQLLAGEVKRQASGFLQDKYKQARLALGDVTPAELYVPPCTI